MNYHFEDIFTNRYWDISGIRMKLIETIRAVSGFLDTNFWLVWCTLDYVTVVFQSSSSVLLSVLYLAILLLLGQIRYLLPLCLYKLNSFDYYLPPTT